MPRIELVEYHKDYVEITINGRAYKYSWRLDDAQHNQAMYVSFWQTYGRNKGRFLNKIKPFLYKETIQNV